MATTFVATSTRVWSAVLRRCSIAARLLRIYVATAPGKTTEGLFPMPIGYAVNDTGLSNEDIRAAFSELSAVGLVDWDEEHEIVLDREALEIANYSSDADNRIKSAVKLVRNLPASPLIAEFRKLTAQLAHPLERALRQSDAEFGRKEIDSGYMG